MQILKETAEIIHNCFSSSIENPNIKSIVDLVAEFRQELLLSAEKVPLKDRANFYVFIDGLNATLHYHIRRLEAASFAYNLCITLVYFTKWLGFNNAKSLARFKGLISDFRKILGKSFDKSISVNEKTIEELSSNIRDRIGARLIIYTSKKEDVFNSWKAYLDVFGGFNPSKKDEFTSWYVNNPSITASHKHAISEILNMPISVGHYKNYIDFPKSNGYSSLQATVLIQFYSKFIPGLEFELQFRSKEMDDVAVSGSAADHKKGQTVVNKIIKIDDPSVLLRLKIGVDDYIPLCACVMEDGIVEVMD